MIEKDAFLDQEERTRRRKLETRGLAAAVVIWSLAALVLSTFSPDLAEAIWIGAAFVKLIFIAAGFAIFAWSLAALRRIRKSALISALVMAGGLFGLFTVGDSVGQQIRFALLRSHFEERVVQITESSEVARRQMRDCVIDEGPPLRIAFYWYRGVIDNWVGLVHDPTGEVMKANEFTRDWKNFGDGRLREVKMLFGGDLYRAKHLRGNWYLCWFT